MRTYMRSGTIPGTIIKRESLNDATGADFLKRVFFVTDKIMLAQIREITGIDGTTLQNWVKRGWVKNPVNKSYSEEMLARILLINMMRDTVQLSRIINLFEYISGDEHEMSESGLYDCVCKVLDRASSGGIGGLDEIVLDILLKYNDITTDAKVRILNGIRIIVVAYYATTMKSTAEYMLDSVESAYEDHWEQ